MTEPTHTDQATKNDEPTDADQAAVTQTFTTLRSARIDLAQLSAFVQGTLNPLKHGDGTTQPIDEIINLVWMRLFDYGVITSDEYGTVGGDGEPIWVDADIAQDVVAVGQQISLWAPRWGDAHLPALAGPIEALAYALIAMLVEPGDPTARPWPKNPPVL